MKTISQDNKLNIDRINFELAQDLYNFYSPFKTSNELKNELKKKLIELNDRSPRKFMNEFILKHYPNEASIKASFVNEVLFRTNNHVSIFEFPLGTSRADLCKINGESSVFEIKTDLDNFTRLDRQLSDYFEVFENVYVICSESKVNTVLKIVNSSVGIYVYKSNRKGTYSFKKYRKAKKSNQISLNKQLRILKKSELADLTMLPSQLSRDELEQNACINFNNNQVNEFFKKSLKNRYKKQWDNLKANNIEIFDLDYQWFYKNPIPSELVYY
ncbi:MAG: sce7726 family protein [Clostridiales bacterium]|nr:sce7726 family protein [Clostridiales bacterium]